MGFRSKCKKPYSNKTTRKIKPKYKSRKPKKQTKYNKVNKYHQKKGGGDIESGEFHVVTIAIITHGCVTTTTPSNNYNIRYYNATGNDLVPHRQTRVDALILPFQFNNSFRQDQPSGDGTNETNEHNITSYFDTLPFDKYIGVQPTESSWINPDHLFNFITGGFPQNGIWLISVHKQNVNEDDFTYDYPKVKSQHINLLSIEGFNMFKNYYNNGMDLDNALKNVKKSTDNKYIEIIRLSYLLDLIKQIIGENCGLNVYDFSCSINCGDSPETTIPTTCIIPTDRKDEELGYKYPFFKTASATRGGKNKNQKRRLFNLHSI
tara:strand:- start:927 stop:1886 length:960 start_codon:yes stop_codon:yes gene_type:complete